MSDPQTSSAEDAELYSGFGEECEQKVEDLEGLVLKLESETDTTEVGKQIYRILHTIKGTAASVGLSELAKYTHKFEDFISPFREGESSPTSTQISVMLRAVEDLKNSMTVLRKGQRVRPDEGFWEAAKTAPEQVAATSTTTAPSKVSVDLSVIDEMLAHSANLMIIRDMVLQDLERASFQYPAATTLRRCLSLLDDMEKENNLLQRSAGALRKTKVSSALRVAQRAIRDLSIQLGKKVNLEMTGTNASIDFDVCQVIADALVHIVRNALDHGIEDAEERKLSGKNPEAKITIAISTFDEELVIAIADDGRGIDAQKIKKKALSKGLLPAEKLEVLSKSALLNLIFESGFSTAEKVTEVSGRGVGLDMVKKGIADLNGRVEIDSELGKGSTFKISIPEKKTTNITHALMVRCQNHVLAVPSEEIIEITEVEKLERENRILFRADCIYVEYKNRYLPALKPIESEAPTEKLSGFIVLIEHQSETLALWVDHVESLDKVIVKDIAGGTSPTSTFKRAALSGRFGLILFLDLNELNPNQGRAS